MNLKLTGKVSFVFLVAYLFSCEIEDDRGVVRSDQGKSLGSYNTGGPILVSENRKESYFITYDNAEMAESLVSVNYETGTYNVLYSAPNNPYTQLILFENQELQNRILFIASEYADNNTTTALYSIDLDSKDRSWILAPNLDNYRITANRNYIFYNYEYNQNYIIKADFSGNSEVLPVRGDVVYAVPGTDQLLIRVFRNDQVKYQLYDHEANVLLDEMPGSYTASKFRVLNESIYLVEYDRVVELLTNTAIFSSAGEFLYDYDPETNMVLSSKHEDFDFFSPRLMLRDLDDGSEITVLHGVYLRDFAKILAEEKSVLYYDSNNGIYIISYD